MRKLDSVIFAIVGPIGNGKGTASSYLERRYNAEIFKFSTPLRKILEILGMEINRDAMQRISQILRESYHQDILSEIAIREIGRFDTRVSIIDGARRIADIQPFLELPNFVLVYVDANTRVRYDRIRTRAENAGDSEKTFEDFLSEEQVEAERNIKELEAYAKYVIRNDAEESDFTAQIDRIVREVLE